MEMSRSQVISAAKWTDVAAARASLQEAVAAEVAANADLQNLKIQGRVNETVTPVWEVNGVWTPIQQGTDPAPAIMYTATATVVAK